MNHGGKNDRNQEYQDSNDSASTSETSEELFAISIDRLPAKTLYVVFLRHVNQYTEFSC